MEPAGARVDIVRPARADNDLIIPAAANVDVVGLNGAADDVSTFVAAGGYTRSAGGRHCGESQPRNASSSNGVRVVEGIVTTFDLAPP